MANATSRSNLWKRIIIAKFDDTAIISNPVHCSVI